MITNENDNEVISSNNNEVLTLSGRADKLSKLLIVPQKSIRNAHVNVILFDAIDASKQAVHLFKQ